MTAETTMEKELGEGGVGEGGGGGMASFTQLGTDSKQEDNSRRRNRNITVQS